MAARTRFIDDQLLRSVEAGVRCHVVLVGAGYDGRPLRFSDLPVRWIEVDHPATQADKRRRLARVCAPSGHISFIEVDLLDGSLDAELARAGHDPAQASLFCDAAQRACRHDLIAHRDIGEMACLRHFEPQVGGISAAVPLRA